MLLSTVVSLTCTAYRYAASVLNSSLQSKENTRQLKMTGCQISYKFVRIKTYTMSTPDILLTYFGALALGLIMLYGTKNYTITIVAGFIVFCIFYFAFAVPSFEWTFSFMFPHIKDAAIIYVISFAVAAIIYKLFPTKKPVGIEVQ